MTKPTESSPRRRGTGLNRRDFMIGGAALGVVSAHVVSDD